MVHWPRQEYQVLWTSWQTNHSKFNCDKIGKHGLLGDVNWEVKDAIVQPHVGSTPSVVGRNECTCFQNHEASNESSISKFYEHREWFAQFHCMVTWIDDHIENDIFHASWCRNTWFFKWMSQLVEMCNSEEFSANDLQLATWNCRTWHTARKSQLSIMLPFIGCVEDKCVIHRWNCRHGK